jgi:hypothetical protein
MYLRHSLRRPHARTSPLAAARVQHSPLPRALSAEGRSSSCVSSATNRLRSLKACCSTMVALGALAAEAALLTRDLDCRLLGRAVGVAPVPAAVLRPLAPAAPLLALMLLSDGLYDSSKESKVGDPPQPHTSHSKHAQTWPINRLLVHTLGILASAVARLLGDWSAMALPAPLPLSLRVCAAVCPCHIMNYNVITESMRQRHLKCGATNMQVTTWRHVCCKAREHANVKTQQHCSWRY